MAQCCVLLKVFAQHAKQGLWNCMSSVRLSVRLSHHSAPSRRRRGFAAVGPATIISINCCKAVLSRKCELCHVIIWRRKLNPDLFLFSNASRLKITVKTFVLIFIFTTTPRRHCWFLWPISECDALYKHSSRSCYTLNQLIWSNLRSRLNGWKSFRDQLHCLQLSHIILGLF